MITETWKALRWIILCLSLLDVICEDKIIKSLEIWPLKNSMYVIFPAVNLHALINFIVRYFFVSLEKRSHQM